MCQSNEQVLECLWGTSGHHHVGHNDAVHFSFLMANEMWRFYKCEAAVLILAPLSCRMIRYPVNISSKFLSNCVINCTVSNIFKCCEAIFWHWGTWNHRLLYLKGNLNWALITNITSVTNDTEDLTSAWGYVSVTVTISFTFACVAHSMPACQNVQRWAITRDNGAKGREAEKARCIIYIPKYYVVCMASLIH